MDCERIRVFLETASAYKVVGGKKILTTANPSSTILQTATAAGFRKRMDYTCEGFTIAEEDLRRPLSYLLQPGSCDLRLKMVPNLDEDRHD